MEAFAPPLGSWFGPSVGHDPASHGAEETASPPGLRRTGTVPFLNEINHLYDFIDTHNESWCKVERVSRPMSKEGIYERQSEGHPGGLPRRDAVRDRQ